MANDEARAAAREWVKDLSRHATLLVAATAWLYPETCEPAREEIVNRLADLKEQAK